MLLNIIPEMINTFKDLRLPLDACQKICSVAISRHKVISVYIPNSEFMVNTLLFISGTVELVGRTREREKGEKASGYQKFLGI